MIRSRCPNIMNRSYKILVTGINGQVGWELHRKASLSGFEVIGCDRNDLDITDQQAVGAKVYQSHPDIVINCAAYTAVDQAETDVEQAYVVNRDGPGWLAESCAALAIPLIHISTDYVFDGQQNRPYTEDDPVSPLGVYGKSKEAGEQAIRQRIDNHLIIRTSWVYGVHGQNFVKTMLRLGGERDELRVVDDQWGCPTFAGDLADALLGITRKIQQGGSIPWGTYHCCGTTKISWHGFASLIFEMARDTVPLQVKRVMAIPTSEFPTPAKRPMYSVFDCSRIKSAFGVELGPLHAGIASLTP